MLGWVSSLAHQQSGHRQPRIALVANSEDTRTQGALIDSHDEVIRFNRCTNFGLAGTKITTLVFVNTGEAGLRYGDQPDSVNPIAVARTREFWFTKKPELISTERERRLAAGEDAQHWIDYSDRLIANRVQSRPYSFFETRIYAEGCALIRAAGACRLSEPSSGLLTLLHLRSAFPSAAVSLFGFSHRGWSGHAWDAERKVINGWIANDEFGLCRQPQ